MASRSVLALIIGVTLAHMPFGLLTATTCAAFDYTGIVVGGISGLPVAYVLIRDLRLLVAVRFVQGPYFSGSPYRGLSGRPHPAPGGRLNVVVGFSSATVAANFHPPLHWRELRLRQRCAPGAGCLLVVARRAEVAAGPGQRRWFLVLLKMKGSTRDPCGHARFRSQSGCSPSPTPTVAQHGVGDLGRT
jgi:hypothetical protein